VPAEAFLDLAIRGGVSFEPGTQFAYNNLAFLVLGELITRISGQPYLEYLTEHVFAPLGMKDTAFAPVDAARAAPVYGFGDKEDQEHWNSLAAPHAGLWSTAADLLALGRAFLNEGRAGEQRLLSPAAIEAMTRVHTQGIHNMVDGRPQPVYQALGWGKASPRGVLLGSDTAFGHGGATGTFMQVDPEWNLVYVCLASRWEGSHNEAIRAFNAVCGAMERGVPETERV
jgi:CubicO group peptidase (beta-lactamase class C family)